MITEGDVKNIDEIVGKLLEHYDSVRIFVSRQDGEKQVTTSVDRGGGNFYAQLGQVADWLTVQNTKTKKAVMETKEEE